MKTNTYKLNNGNTILYATAKRRGTSTALLNGVHYAYDIVLEVAGGGSVSFRFHDSINNYNMGKRENESMIHDAVNCIISDAYAIQQNPTLHEFAAEFGYDVENIGKASKAFTGCDKTYKKLQRILRSYEMDELYELTR